jgi:tellurite resistance protein
MSSAPTPTAERVRSLLASREAALVEHGTLLDQATPDVFLSVLVEAAYLLASADGVVSAPERQTLVSTIAHVLGGELPPEELVAMIDAFAEALTQDGRDRRLAAMGHALPDPPARRAVVAFAALIALCDREFVSEEREMLDLLGATFGLDQAAVRAILNEVADSLTG